MAESIPHLLGGRYEVRSLIGRGGMAEVHLGFDTRLSRIVAIKTLRIDLARDSVFQARFRREAQSAASLNHPNIVAVYDTGEEPQMMPDGQSVSVPYIVMEYVEGRPVKDLLSDGAGAFPIHEAGNIVAGVLSALEYSHAAGLIHRDIKPGNVMLTTKGEVKVMDFGIARAVTDSQATMTQTNAVVGTAQYLSPEQARGEQVDARSDLYSAGVLLFELLTGQPPFTGDSAVAVAYQHVQQLPPVPSSIASDIPEAMDRVVLKALAKNRDDRYSSAAAMKADLLRAMHGAEVNAPATAVWQQLTPTPGNTAVTTTLPPLPSPPPSVHTPTATTTLSRTRAAADVDEQKKKKSIPIIVAIVALLAIAVAGLGWVLTNNGTTKATVDVPNVVGMTQAEAMSAIKNAGLEWALADQPVESETVPAGSVVSTNPPGGSQVKSGSRVTAILSAGPASVSIPDNLKGMSPDEAKAAVEKLGLKWALSDQQVTSEDVEKGKIAKTNPSFGSKVKSGSTVTGYVSSGSEKVNVPDVSGMTQDQAREALTQKGLTVGNVLTADDPTAPANRIVRTDPVSGSEVKRGDAVTLVIATGDVVIPRDLTGQDYRTVASALEELGLRVTIVQQYNRNAAAGVVTGMTPGDGQKVSQGSSVTVYVSQGAQPGTGSTPAPTRSGT